MKQRGFTLIELVIVVAIVGILASAAMPLARWSVKRNKEYLLQQNLRIIRTAIDRYHDAAQAGLIEVPEGASGYPPDLKTLVEGVPLIAQMPPVMPGVSDEYAATGPGLTGGLRSQLEAGDQSGMTGGFGTTGAGGAAGLGQGAATGTPGGAGRRSLFGTQSDAQQGGQRQGSGLGSFGQGSVGQGGLRQSGLGQGGLRQGGLGQGGLSQGGLAQGAPVEPLIGADGQVVKLMFLRRIPVDPMTGKAEWGSRCYGEPPTDRLWCGRDVFDIYSKALSDAIDGTKYRDW
jgi:general secretion pathway protein G